MAIFALQLLIIKIGKTRLVTILLSSLLICIWLINLTLFQKKSQTQIEIINYQQPTKITDIRLELDQNKISENLKYYQELRKQQPYSRDLLYNLAILQTANDQKEIANENFNLSVELDPNF